VLLVPAEARRGLRLNSGLRAALRRLIVVLFSAVLAALMRVVAEGALAATLLVALVVAALLVTLRSRLVANPAVCRLVELALKLVNASGASVVLASVLVDEQIELARLLHGHRSALLSVCDAATTRDVKVETVEGGGERLLEVALRGHPAVLKMLHVMLWLRLRLRLWLLLLLVHDGLQLLLRRVHWSALAILERSRHLRVLV